MWQIYEVKVRGLTWGGLIDKSKVQSNYMVLPNKESVNDEAFDASRLLEEVLERRWVTDMDLEKIL